MKATSITAHETSFKTNGLDSNGKKFILTNKSVAIGNTTNMLNYIDIERQTGDKKAHYYEEEFPKKKILIHFTMGYLKGDIATLTNGHVSVPFVVGRGGEVYKLFSSKYWSYHLGASASGGNTAMSKECIGIEISNIGPLIKDGNLLRSTYSGDNVYCDISETQFYTKLATPYRGYQYYASFTDAQYNSVIKLIQFLSSKYNIPKTFIPVANRYNTMSDADFTNYNGVASHVNCRLSKVDIGAAFDWDRVINGV